MRLSLSELRKIIAEESETMDSESPEIADPPAPEAAPEPAAEDDPIKNLPDMSEDATSLVRSLGLTPDLDANGDDSLGSALGKFITMIDNNREGTIEKLSEAGNIARLLQAMSDYLTLEILEIANVELDGVPTREEFKQRLLAKSNTPD